MGTAEIWVEREREEG
jgi:hypothetical protein